MAYLRQYRNVTGQHLMVVPKSTMGNWVNEFTRWCPDVDVLAFHGNREERADMIRERLAPRAFDVCVTSYEMVLREKGAIKKIPWHLLVVDEAHRLKNESSILSQVRYGLPHAWRRPAAVSDSGRCRSFACSSRRRAC